MEKKEIEIGSPVTVGRVTLIPVTELSLNCWHGKGRVSFFGMKQPVAILVVSPSAKRAFRVTGEEVQLDQFVKEVPGIREVLDGI